MSWFSAIRLGKLAARLSTCFWLLVALILTAANLRSGHVSRALVFGTLPLLCLGYSMYGRQFTHARWRGRSASHHLLWFAVAAGAVAGVALSIGQLPV